MAVLAAGPDASTVVQIATETVLQTVVPTLEEAVKGEACNKLCGEYGAWKDAPNSFLIIAVDGDTGLLDQSLDSSGA